MSIKVFTAEEALAAVTADVTKVLNIEKKKEDKAYKGTKFLNVYWNISNEVKKSGWFSIEDVELTDGVADPANKNDKRNDFEGTRLQLQTTVSKCGAFGQFLLTLNPEFKATLLRLVEDKTIVLLNRDLHDLVQLTLAMTNEKNPGGIIEDPIIRFKVDFRTFPPTYMHKFMAGLPKTQFFDWNTRYLDDAGREQFKAAMVTDPVTGLETPVVSENLHLFVTKGSIIRKGRIMMPSVAISSKCVSMPIQINRCVLEPGASAGFSDEAPVTAVKPTVAPAAGAAQVAEVQPMQPAQQAADMGDVEALLASI